MGKATGVLHIGIAGMAAWSFPVEATPGGLFRTATLRPRLVCEGATCIRVPPDELCRVQGADVFATPPRVRMPPRVHAPQPVSRTARRRDLALLIASLY